MKMSYFVRFMIVLAVAISTVYATNIVLKDDVVASYAEAFEKYQIKFGKHYGTKEEYDEHLRAYATSMERIKEFYKKNPDSKVILGETSRSDFVGPTGTRHVGKANSDEKRAWNKNSFPQPKLAKNHTKDNIPVEFNWFNVSDVKHPPKNQKRCGGCWAFAATGALEMQSVLAGNEFVNLSVQQNIDCSVGGSDGCCGGDESDAYSGSQNFIAEENYPYLMDDWHKGDECRPYECNSTGKKVEVSINGFDKFYAMTAEELKKEIWMYGPVTVGFDVPDEFNDYVDGIFDCTFLVPDGAHAVIAVGFGDGYIALRNSWGVDWGMEGDFLLSDEDYDASCHLLAPNDPSDVGYPVARVSVVGPPEPSPSPEPSPEPSSNSMNGASALFPISLVFILAFLQMKLVF